MLNGITIMIVSTIPDMFAEHYYFVKHVFPQLKDICMEYDISLDYVDLFFSMSEDEINNGRTLRKYLQSMDFDRTFFVCFRGQKLGRAPTYKSIDKKTLDEYPELVDYIGDISFTELIIMHALQPFEKNNNGEHKNLPPVKHALFYFRDNKFLDNLDSSQKEFYTSNGISEDSFVRDLKLAMAKDLIVNEKEESENNDNGFHINIHKYEGIWDDDLSLREVLDNYIHEYASMNNFSYDFLSKLGSRIDFDDLKGSFNDFKCEGKDLKEVMAEDFFNELKLEFPDLFESVV